MIIGACFTYSVDASGIMEQHARGLEETENGTHKNNRAKNADEGKQYGTHTNNKDANLQFEKGFFPYDPGEAYTGYYW